MTKIAPAPPSILDFSRRCLFSPSRAAEAAKATGSLSPALCIYAAFLLASAAFYAWKPFDFPDRNAPFPRETQSLWFWLKVMLYQPPLEFVWVAFLLALLEWFRDGKLFWRIVGAVIATALPFGLLIAYQQNSLSWGAYFALAMAWVAAMAFWARRVPIGNWVPVASLMCALNIVGLLLLAPMWLSVQLGAEGLFKGAQIAGGLWILGCGTLGLRALTGLRLPRCFMSVLLSMFMQIALAFTLHMLGLVPKDILKALLLA